MSSDRQQKRNWNTRHALCLVFTTFCQTQSILMSKLFMHQVCLLKTCNKLAKHIFSTKNHTKQRTERNHTAKHIMQAQYSQKNTKKMFVSKAHLLSFCGSLGNSFYVADALVHFAFLTIKKWAAFTTRQFTSRSLFLAQSKMVKIVFAHSWLRNCFRVVSFAFLQLKLCFLRCRWPPPF